MKLFSKWLKTEGVALFPNLIHLGSGSRVMVIDSEKGGWQEAPVIALPNGGIWNPDSLELFSLKKSLWKTPNEFVGAALIRVMNPSLPLYLGLDKNDPSDEAELEEIKIKAHGLRATHILNILPQG